MSNILNNFEPSSQQFEEKYRLQIEFEEANKNPAKLSRVLRDAEFDAETFFSDYVEYRRAKTLREFVNSSEAATKYGNYALNSYLLDFGSALFFDHMTESGESNEFFESYLKKLSKLVPESLRQYKNLAVTELIKKGIFSEGYDELKAELLSDFDTYTKDYLKHAISLTKLPKNQLWQEISRIALRDASEKFEEVSFSNGNYLKSDLNPLKLRQEIVYGPLSEYIRQEVDPLFWNLYSEVERKSSLGVSTSLERIKGVSEKLNERFGINVYASIEPYVGENNLIMVSDLSSIEFDRKRRLSAIFSKYSTPSDLKNLYQKARDLFTYSGCC